MYAVLMNPRSAKKADWLGRTAGQRELLGETSESQHTRHGDKYVLLHERPAVRARCSQRIYVKKRGVCAAE